MKKNTMMRVASVLLVAVLLSTCVISSTFAKYTTQVSSSDSARVAKWGFNTASINFENLFASSYTNVSNGTDEQAIIAPGTSGEVTFKFENAIDGTPEVAYTFVVDTNDSACAEAIQKNANITWALAKTSEKDSATYGSWTQLITAIENLDQNKTYAADEIPEMVDTEYTILWKWTYENNDDGNDNDNFNDTDLGNTAVTNDLVVTLKVTITATQISGENNP